MLLQICPWSQLHLHDRLRGCLWRLLLFRSVIMVCLSWASFTERPTARAQERKLQCALAIDFLSQNHFSARWGHRAVRYLRKPKDLRRLRDVEPTLECSRKGNACEVCSQGTGASVRVEGEA